MSPPPVNAETETVRQEPDQEPDLAVEILIESEGWQNLPDAEDIARRAIAMAGSVIAASDARILLGNVEISLLLCDDATIAALNGRWRGQEKPTNVLSFPAWPLHGSVAIQEKMLLGDIAVAYETLAREAGESGKTASAHLSHLVVHGFLHLAGYDHETDEEAEEMERLECDILARLGIADPYAVRDADI